MTTSHSQPAVTLTTDEENRYARQLVLPEIDRGGQLRLKNSAVLVVGAGGLGSAALLYLAAAGVGRIGIADPDRIEPGNLNRQILHDTPGLGMLKVESARKKMLRLNPEIRVDLFPEAYVDVNAEKIADSYTVVVDACDNLDTRFLINRVCVRQAKPMVYGSVQRLEGQCGVFHASEGACFRCMLSGLPPAQDILDPAQAGILGAIAGIIGAWQALETIKILTQSGSPLFSRICIIDGFHGGVDFVIIPKKPDCPECGH